MCTSVRGGDGAAGGTEPRGAAGICLVTACSGGHGTALVRKATCTFISVYFGPCLFWLSGKREAKTKHPIFHGT